MRLPAFVILGALIVACAHPHPVAPTAPAADQPYELADDLDLAERADLLHALPAGAERTALRADLTAALFARIDRFLEARRADRVDALIGELVLLWSDEPAAMVAGLHDHLPVLERARAAFARAGSDRESAMVLVLLSIVQPSQAAAYQAELEEVLTYADDLARARMGTLGTGSGEIAALEPIVTRVPSVATLTDRYVERVIARANAADAAVNGALAAGKPVPDSAAIRMAFKASRDIAVALAFAHRADAIAPALARLSGIGRTRVLGSAAAAVAAPAADARTWAALARQLRDDHEGPPADDESVVVRAALAICSDGLSRFPGDATLLAAAAGHAADLERVSQPIALYEEARRIAPGDPELADRLTGLYRERVGRLVFGGRPVAAKARLDDLHHYYDQIGAAFPGRRWSSTWAEALATYGRGLVSVGDLRDARTQLDRSITSEPTVEALEMLGTVALKLGDYPAARRHLQRGAELGGDTPSDLYARAKILRLAGEAAQGAGDPDGAGQVWFQALNIWEDLGKRVELPPNLAGERFVEIGKLLWELGQHDMGAEMLERAVEADPGGADTHVQAIAFLLLHDEIDRADEVFYQALGSDRIGDYYKVYLSLWVIAEDRRAGRPDDRLAAEYLAARNGPLWYDDVARLATGRIGPDALGPRANTRARKAELTYYTAVLSPTSRPPAEVRRLLQDVVGTEMVLFFEYDMARRYLGRP